MTERIVKVIFDIYIKDIITCQERQTLSKKMKLKNFSIIFFFPQSYNIFLYRPSSFNLTHAVKSAFLLKRERQYIHFSISCLAKIGKLYQEYTLDTSCIQHAIYVPQTPRISDYHIKSNTIIQTSQTNRYNAAKTTPYIWDTGRS